MERKKLLDKYYTFQSTLHGLSLYEGLLNEGATVTYIMDVEKWLIEAEKAIDKASRIDATDLLELAKERVKIKSEILSKSRELHKLRIREKAIIEAMRAQMTS